ncbi:(5-formylfuran-3-yl)methyl phosphate synthase [Azohydromonas australica]|uniref:(5-formylfuran-3-yl)methyl phosphate synthase n=1 Tax=Azohydromonas australica TaxID=364039 RepID=UPI0003FA3C16|nr:(5-formylfuran-3-yl)methyl phosphate synthase [Azohydromonas australica]
MKLLVSVRDVPEALAAASSGVDFIDLKEPAAGALGGLAPATIARVAMSLHERGFGQPVSATIGDWRVDDRVNILQRVREVAACAVDYVKVGVEPGREAELLLDALAHCGVAVVPVLIADRGVDAALLRHACELPFPALMLDTADKLAGSLFDCVDASMLAAVVEQVRCSGKLVGLAGALRRADVPSLTALAPDFAGFRSAVCDGPRSGVLVPALVQDLAAALHFGFGVAAT